MNKTLLTLFLLITVFKVNAQVTQEWITDLYNENSNFNYMKIDNGGNVYILGDITTFAYYTKIITVKYNSSGEELWANEFETPASYLNTSPRGLAIDNDGNVFVTGVVYTGSTDHDLITIKYDSIGVEQWVQIYDPPDFKRIEDPKVGVDNNGNVYVSGTESGMNITDPKYLTIKYNSSGVVQWVRRYTSGNPDHAETMKAMLVDAEGNIFVSGLSHHLSHSDASIHTIKYNSSGNQEWVTIYQNGLYNVPQFISLDESGNIYLAGETYYWDSYWIADFVVIKYNLNGVQQWAQTYTQGFYITSLELDSENNVFISGVNDDNNSILIIKYNSSGVQQWINSISNLLPYSGSGGYLTVDSLNNIYVHYYLHEEGYGNGGGIIKYNSNGVEMWELEGNDKLVRLLKIDNSGNLYASDGYTLNKYSQQPGLFFTRPRTNTKFMAGEKDTIKWSSGQPDQFLEIEYSINNGTTYTNLNVLVAADSNQYIWDVPDTLLTTKAKIKITDWLDPTKTRESAAFRIKPYVLTRLTPEGDYYEYRKNRDPWGFSNIANDMWPATWYNQFNYQGTDPFTGYSYLLAPSWLSLFSSSSDHPDWESWVNTFGINACYLNSSFPPVYSPTAVFRWYTLISDWGGSCFGIAVANALAFRHGDQFREKYPEFPNFVDPNPISVTSNNAVKKVINELFTHQFRNPHFTPIQEEGLLKTPTQTLNELKEMFKEDSAQVRTLTLINFGIGGGAHAILAYGLEQDSNNPTIYRVKVYDNSFPASNKTISIYTTENGGNGAWINNDLGWGGEKGLYLMGPTADHLTNPTMSKKTEQYSPFVLDNDQLQVFNKLTSSLRIEDNLGNVTGFYNNSIHTDIPGSTPFVANNGSETPPYGYSLPIDFGGGGGMSSIYSSSSYSVTLDDFQADNVGAFFFTGNKSFSYERNGAAQTQTDKLFFDGGISVVNPDAQPKTVKLTNIIKSSGGGGGYKAANPQNISNSAPEQVYIISSLNIVQNDSIKIVNTYSDDLEIINFGSAKNYQIELNYATTGGLGVFVNSNVTLPPNSTHQLIPEWYDINDLQLMIQVDEGNDGTIDTTYSVENQWGDPVPVELLAFDATNTTKGIHLNWQTSTEVNNYGFEVERKSLAENNTEGWTKLGFVPGTGNSNSPKLYSFTDKTAKEGKYLYRLRQIDTDGKFQFSNVIELDVKNIPLVFALEQNYPNPFNPSTTISWQSPVSSHQTLIVYDVLGNEVVTLVNEFREAGRYEITFDASNLASGIYLYKLQVNPEESGKNSFTAIKKMIVIK